MIKLKSIIVAAFIALTMNLQAQTYNFSVSTGTYTDLSGSTSLNNGSTWDDLDTLVTIGFDFQLFDTILSELVIGDGNFGGLDISNIGANISPLVIYYGISDFVDRGYDIDAGISTTGSLSNISYLLEGDAGSRIFKIEWNNVGFYDELFDDNVSEDFTNIQLWLYEGTNDFELHFGPSSISQPELSFLGATGPGFALISSFDAEGEEIDGEAYVLTGDSSSPVMEEFTSVDDDLEPLQGNAPDGTIYRFSRNTTGLSEIQEPFSFSVYPNPAKDQFSVVVENDEVKVEGISILDNHGRLVKLAAANFNQINVSDLVSGVYIVQITTDKGLSTQKLIIE
jgi:hypothetical protein